MATMTEKAKNVSKSAFNRRRSMFFLHFSCDERLDETGYSFRTVNSFFLVESATGPSFTWIFTSVGTASQMNGKIFKFGASFEDVETFKTEKLPGFFTHWQLIAFLAFCLNFNI